AVFDPVNGALDLVAPHESPYWIYLGCALFRDAAKLFVSRQLAGWNTEIRPIHEADIVAGL
ncbi:MAG: hypothetical protein KKB02_20070, partial [Alphaproteobacteria bacterium]|nr:hypothetical protein [Alphaproteobacteria bacterium]